MCLMKKIFSVLFIVLTVSCGRRGTGTGERIITVSIAPFKYFVEAIAGDDFEVNIMVPSGADPHVYEPFPEQINMLRNSVGYISDGFLGFENTWLDRFYETNRSMKRLSLGEKMDLLYSGNHHEGDHDEGPDPHYWMSLNCALSMASSIKDFLCGLNPVHKQQYEVNYQIFITKIQKLNKKAQELFSGLKNKTFMIYHPNLGYLARDYGLKEISVEYEGKEPPPSRMKELIDLARKDGLKTIFVQREYDTRNAEVIASQIGAQIKIIDPLSEDWLPTMSDIVTELYDSISENSK